MQAIEFTTQLNNAAALSIPTEARAKLPNTGFARVIVLTEQDPMDAGWQAGAYEQFLRDDAPEDSIYDTYLKS
jgi:hypothetical protein